LMKPSASNGQTTSLFPTDRRYGAGDPKIR